MTAVHIGDVLVRNSGIIGGNLLHSYPWSDYPGVVLAFQVTIVASVSAGNRVFDPLVFSGI